MPFEPRGAGVKFLLLPLLGALIYHAIQVQRLMSGFIGMLLTAKNPSFLGVFWRTAFESFGPPVSFSGPRNLAIGGGIGLGLALVAHYARRNVARGAARRARRGDVDPDQHGDDDESNDDLAGTAQPRGVSNALFVLLLVGALGAGAFASFSTRGEASLAQPHEADSSKRMRLRFDVQGEYFTDYAGHGDRSLYIFGVVTNESSESYVGVECDLEVALELDAVERRVVVRGNGCPWFSRIGAGDTTDFGARNGFSYRNAVVERKWIDYGIRVVRIRLKATARNAMDESLAYDSGWIEIPAPQHRSSFPVAFR